MKDRDMHPLNSSDKGSEEAETDKQKTESGPRSGAPAFEAAPLAQWAHLQILERVGTGSYGEVYRARDPNLDREVALKLLRVRMESSSSSWELMLKEGRLLARIHHPNVVTVYGAGESGGRVGLWMEFIQGKSLDQLLHEGGLYGAREAAGIGLDLCRALAAIHKANLIHGDVKARNVMREQGGRIVLMDLGLGTERQQAQAEPGQGSPSGTPLYMSPELLRGSRATESSDIYALAVMLYYLASGSFPVDGRDFQALRQAHEKGDRKLLRDARPDLPEPFVAVVERAISPDPASRYASAGQMEQALARLEWATDITAEKHPPLAGKWSRLRLPARGAIILGLSAILLLLGWVSFTSVPIQSFFGHKAAPSAPSQRSVAILPFLNRGSPDSDYFCEGISEDIITQLAKIHDIKVISQNSAGRFQNSGKSSREIGKELGVSSILTGSVRKEGNIVRITSSLVDAQSGHYLWTDSYDRELKDIFQIEKDVATRIAGALQATLSQREKESVGKEPTANTEAHDLYLKGRFLSNTRTLDGIQKGLESFQQAIMLDQGDALAYVGLADCYSFLEYYSYRPSQNKLLQKTAAMKAISLDDDLAEGHLSLAMVYDEEWNWAGAEGEFLRGIDLKPGLATAHHWYAHHLALLGRTREAIGEMQHARELDPLSVTINSAYGWILYVAREYDAAIDQFKVALDVDPTFVPALVEMGKTYAARGEFQKGIAELKKATSIDGSAGREAMLAFTYAAAGNREEAGKIRRKLMDMSDAGQDISPGDIAVISTGLGDIDAAFHWLDLACRKKDFWIAFLQAEPVFDKLRSDSRFKQLLIKAGFKE